MDAAASKSCSEMAAATGPAVGGGGGGEASSLAAEAAWPRTAALDPGPPQAKVVASVMPGPLCGNGVDGASGCSNGACAPWLPPSTPMQPPWIPARSP